MNILDGIVLMVMVYAPLMLVAIGGPALVQADGDVSGAGSMLVMVMFVIEIG